MNIIKNMKIMVSIALLAILLSLDQNAYTKTEENVTVKKITPRMYDNRMFSIERDINDRLYYWDCDSRNDIMVLKKQYIEDGVLTRTVKTSRGKGEVPYGFTIKGDETYGGIFYEDVVAYKNSKNHERYFYYDDSSGKNIISTPIKKYGKTVAVCWMP